MLNNYSYMPDYSDEQLHLTARLYYVDQLPQDEVARLAGVSQSKISRLLALARERGIVRISVAEYQPRNTSLEKELKKTIGIESAIVIKTLENLSIAQIRETVARFGAPVVSGMIPSKSAIAVAGGRTMRELVSLLDHSAHGPLTVLQAMGNIDSSVLPIDAIELAQTMARRCGGSFLTLNTPALLPNKQIRDAFLALEQIRSVEQKLNKANFALVGIGTLENSVFMERGVLNRQDVITLKRCGAVGEICGRFFDMNGRECDSPYRDRVVSIKLETLRKIPQVIGVVAGSDRAAAILAATRGGILKSLLIDEAGAASLLSAAKDSK